MPLWIKRIIFFVLLFVAASAWGFIGGLAGIPQVFITLGVVIIAGGGVANFWPK